jgi:hypothetical protein
MLGIARCILLSFVRQFQLTQAGTTILFDVRKMAHKFGESATQSLKREKFEVVS